VPDQCFKKALHCLDVNVAVAGWQQAEMWPQKLLIFWCSDCLGCSCEETQPEN